MLWNNIRKHKPDVVSVQQAYRARAFLRRIKGYKVFHHPRKPGAEYNGVAVLVRDDIEVVSVKWLKMNSHWVGGKAGKHHTPRVYPALRLRKKRAELYFVGVHLPTHNSEAAQRESLQTICRYFNNHSNSAVAAAGDWNRRAVEMRWPARAVKGEYHDTGKVDGALTARCNHLVDFRVQFPGYAHGWGIHRIDVEVDSRPRR